jgi:hypothetical protein
MPYDIPAPQNLSRVRSRAQLKPYQSQNALPSTSEVPPIRADGVRRIEPMLLVHQQQVETFRLIAAAFRRGLRALARPYTT